jgi:hypothetical protein
VLGRSFREDGLVDVVREVERGGGGLRGVEWPSISNRLTSDSCQDCRAQIVSLREVAVCTLPVTHRFDEINPCADASSVLMDVSADFAKNFLARERRPPGPISQRRGRGRVRGLEFR